MPMLLLFRHAKAAPPLAGQRDFDRELTERGRRDCERMGKILAEFGVDQAIVSSAQRTRETWEIASRAFLPRPPVSVEQTLYLCRSNQLVARIRQIPDGVDRVVLVGHNPTWHEVALRFAGGTAAAGVETEALRDKFPTAALAVFTFAAASWAGLEPGHAKLERFVTPGMAR